MSKENNLFKNRIYSYLFLFANILILLGIGISWVLCNKNQNVNQTLIISVFSISSAVIAGVFFYFETREISLVSMHINKKLVQLYILSCVFYLVSLVFSVAFQLICTKYLQTTFKGESEKYVVIFYSIELAIGGFFSFLSQIIFKIVCYKIDFALWKRRNGSEEIKRDEYSEDKKKEDENNSKIKEATSGLS